MTPTMRKLCLFAGMLCLTSMPMAAQTVLNGNITKDSLLEVANSPYLISSNLTINPGCTLTIPENVVLKVSNNVSIDVWGTLNAEGATFKSVNTSPNPGDWGYIRVGNYEDSAKLILMNCRLESFKEIYVRNKGLIESTNTPFVNSYGHGIYLENGGRLTMTGGSIETLSTNAKNGSYGLTGNNLSSAILSNVTIQGYNTGLRMNGGSLADVTGGTITACTYPILFTNPASLTTHGTLFLTGNDNDVAYVDFYEQYDNWNLSYLPIPYFFRWFRVNEAKKLTIASGNVLKFYDGGSSLNVEGSLCAVANPGEYIYFTSFRDDNLGGDSNNDNTSSAPSSGDWPGIRFADNSSDSLSVLRRCAVRYAGYNSSGGIYTYSASPTIDSCDISNNYIGFYLEGLSNPIITHSEVASSALTPIAMSFEANPIMHDNILSESDNHYDAIGILPGTILGNAHLKVRSMTVQNNMSTTEQPNMTYYLMGDVVIPFGRTLTIDKGITIKAFHEGNWYNRHLLVYGNLVADATADSLITFTSVRDDNEGADPNKDCNNDGTITFPSVGDWGGIIFFPGSSGLMDYCKVKYADIHDHTFSSCDQTIWIDNAAVAIIDANPTISNTEFKDLNHAIFCYRAANPVLENLKMVNILYSPINLSSTSDPVITNITHTNVGWNALGLIGGPVCLNGTLKQRNVAGFNNITYMLLSDMTINSGSKIKVDPGVVIKFTDGTNGFYGRNIFVDGGFMVMGTAQQPVVFTSAKDDNEGYDVNGDGNATKPESGDWGAIKFRQTAIDTFNVMDHVIVKYGGYTQEGCLTYENAGGQLKHATVTNSKYYGLYFNGNAAPSIDGVSILNCNLDPIALSLKSNPTFSNMEFVSNASKAIKIIEGNLSSDAILAPRSMAGIDNIAYIVERLEIASGAKLTILPGVVVKFRTEEWPWISYIKSMGNLIAKGTPENKIYFTSYKDDSKGGDSNNNGNTDAPAPGDWGQYKWDYDITGGIMFANNTAVSDSINVLSNCEISYPTLGVRVDNAHATIDSCTIQLCANFGLASYGSANPSVKNTKFYNIGWTPIELSMFSEPTFANCSASNVGFMAMTVVPETFSKTDTIPVRSFAGFDNINYLLGLPCTINSGCTITVPAGVTFKSTHYIPTSKPWTGSGDYANGFVVNGRLNILGTAAKPVVFTNAYDDSYGSPADMNMDGRATNPYSPYTNGLSGSWLTFTDVSADSSRIDHAVFKFGKYGVSLQSASPVINASRFEQLHLGIDMSGISQPAIDSCVFHDLAYMPIQVSLVAYPRSTAANIISGTTYKVIKVRNETLTQDVTLPKRNFGGKENIPYLFGDYTIGTSAILTIKPGVICKFKNYYDNSYYFDGWSSGSITVSRGLIAEGGSSPDSAIVFTSLFDDFYGGDSNSDGQGRIPSANGDAGWQGLKFLNVSLDEDCRLNNCIIRYAINGIQTTTANPSISHTLFNRNGNGVLAEGASNPLLIECDFNENAGYAVKNVGESFTIQAINSWWGSNDGPIVNNSNTNHQNDQEFITTGVNVEPWRTIGIQKPLTGDVSLNGFIQAYDASLVLKQNVSLITLNDTQLSTGDVSGDGNLSALDASLILQYVVDINNNFPVNRIAAKRAPLLKEGISLSVPSFTVNGESTFILKVAAKSLTGLAGANVRFRFDPTLLEAVSLVKNQPSMSMEYRIDNIKGTIDLAMAGANALSAGTDLSTLTFKVKATSPTVTDVQVERFLANEIDMTNLATAGTITINRVPVGLSETETGEAGMDPLTPNPFKGEASLIYRVKGAAQPVRIEVFNAAGNSMAVLVDKTHDAGTYSIRITDKELPLQPGVYVIRMKSGNSTYTQKIQVAQ